MNDRYNAEVGERIKKARKAKKMSMKHLGELVHLHESTISRYEKGGIMALDVEKLKEVARVLGVSVSYLMGMEETPTMLHVRKNMSIEEFANEFDIEVDRIELVFSVAKFWKTEVGVFDFDETETQELIRYAKYLISKRNDK